MTQIPEDHFGYNSREDLIRAHWERYGRNADWDWRKRPRFKVAVRHRLPVLPTWEEATETITAIPVLEFSRERGTMDGLPWARIVCEGIVVAEGQLL